MTPPRFDGVFTPFLSQPGPLSVLPALFYDILLFEPMRIFRQGHDVFVALARMKKN
jgi:hypothetical protein